MGYYTNIFIKPRKASLVQSWKGSLVMDWDGNVIVSTLSSSLSAAKRRLVIKTLLALLSASSRAGLPLAEFTACYGKLELRLRVFKRSIHVLFQ